MSQPSQAPSPLKVNHADHPNPLQAYTIVVSLGRLTTPLVYRAFLLFYDQFVSGLFPLPYLYYSLRYRKYHLGCLFVKSSKCRQWQIFQEFSVKRSDTL